jgi:hypothetical protein
MLNLAINNIQLKKNKYGRGVVAFLAHWLLLPDRKVEQPPLKPGNVVDIRIVGMSKSRKSLFFQVVEEEGDSA